MSKEDWIILRLIAEAIRARPFCAPDHLKAIGYLNRKYGEDMLNTCIDQLKAERKAA